MPSKTALQLAARYTQIFKLAEVEPQRALAAWSELLASHSAAPFPAVHARALRILVERIRQFPHPSEESAISATIIEANAALAAATRAASVDTGEGMGFTLSDPPPLRRNAGGEMLTARNPRRLLTDVVALQRVAADWSDEHWCTWLLEGFSEIIGGSREAYSAFPPLRLYPVGNYLVQLADALTDGQPADSPVRDKVSSALGHHLIAGGAGDVRDALAWALFARFGRYDPNAGVGRLFVARSAARRGEIDDETLEQICAYGWQRCSNETARADFFRSIGSSMSERIAGWKGAADLEEISAVLPDGEKELFEVARNLTGSRSFHSEQATLQLEWILAHDDLHHFDIYDGVVTSAEHLRQKLSEMALKAKPVTRWSPPAPNSVDRVLAELDA